MLHKEINFHQSKINRTLVLVLLSHWHMQRNYLNLKVSKNSSEIVNVSLINGQKALCKIGKKLILNLPNFPFVNYICTADGEIISLLKIFPFCTLMVSYGAHEEFFIKQSALMMGATFPDSLPAYLSLLNTDFVSQECSSVVEHFLEFRRPQVQYLVIQTDRHTHTHTHAN